MNEIKLHGEIPQIESKADGELPSISVDEQFNHAYRTLRAIEEAEQKKQRKHDFSVAAFSTILGAFLGNLDRIVKLIKELIFVLKDLLKVQ